MVEVQDKVGGVLPQAAPPVRIGDGALTDNLDAASHSGTQRLDRRESASIVGRDVHPCLVAASKAHALAGDLASDEKGAAPAGTSTTTDTSSSTRLCARAGDRSRRAAQQQLRREQLEAHQLEVAHAVPLDDLAPGAEDGLTQVVGALVADDHVEPLAALDRVVHERNRCVGGDSALRLTQAVATVEVALGDKDHDDSRRVNVVLEQVCVAHEAGEKGRHAGT